MTYPLRLQWRSITVEVRATKVFLGFKVWVQYRFKHLLWFNHLQSNKLPTSCDYLVLDGSWALFRDYILLTCNFSWADRIHRIKSSSMNHFEIRWYWWIDVYWWQFYTYRHGTVISFPASNGGSIWNMASIGLAVSEEKKFEKVESEWPWTKVNEWSWPWVVINCHVLIYLTICTDFHHTEFISF